MRLPPIVNDIVGGIVVLAVWQFLVKPVWRRIQGFDEVMWRGETFKLKQQYLDYEEYKEDSDPLATNEVERVKQFMLAISVPKATPHRGGSAGVPSPDALPGIWQQLCRVGEG